MRISNIKYQISNKLQNPNSKSQALRKKISRIIVAVIIVLILVVSIYYVYREYYLASKKATIAAEIPANIKINKKVALPIFIDTAGLTINAAEVYLKFDPTTLKVESVSKDNSFFQLWIMDEPKFNNEKGEISFAGGLPTPGFKGEGQIGSVEIIPLKSGWQEITFDAETRALRNDGAGTAIPLNLRPIFINAR